MSAGAVTHHPACMWHAGEACDQACKYGWSVPSPVASAPAPAALGPPAGAGAVDACSALGALIDALDDYLHAAGLVTAEGEPMWAPQRMHRWEQHILDARAEANRAYAATPAPSVPAAPVAAEVDAALAKLAAQPLNRECEWAVATVRNAIAAARVTPSARNLNTAAEVEGETPDVPDLCEGCEQQAATREDASGVRLCGECYAVAPADETDPGRLAAGEQAIRVVVASGTVCDAADVREIAPGLYAAGATFPAAHSSAATLTFPEVSDDDVRRAMELAWGGQPLPESWVRSDWGALMRRALADFRSRMMAGAALAPSAGGAQ